MMFAILSALELNCREIIVVITSCDNNKGSLETLSVGQQENRFRASGPKWENMRETKRLSASPENSKIANAPDLFLSMSLFCFCPYSLREAKPSFSICAHRSGGKSDAHSLAGQQCLKSRAEIIVATKSVNTACL